MPGVITVPFLSTQRFGNACFIYCFCKAFALAHGATLECPDWIGRKVLANADEPFITHSLKETELDARSMLPLGYWFKRTNIAIKAYCQHQIYLDWYSRAQVREWLKFKPEYEAFAPTEKKPYSAMHIRRGDYATAPLNKYYCEVSNESYERALKQFNIPEPVIRVQEGWRAPHPELPPELSWLSDFLLLRDAAHLLRANSSFSVFASWLGHGKTYSPVVGDKVGPNHCEFVEGNHPCTAGRFANQSNLILREE